MKNLFKIILLAVIIGAAGCTTVEDLAPADEREPEVMQTQEMYLKVHHSYVELDNTTGQGFNHPIDVNGNNTVDFYFKTESTWVTDEGGPNSFVYSRLISTVRLVPTQAQNGVVSKETTPEYVCGEYMYFTPTDALNIGDAISSNSNWSDESTCNVLVRTAYDCQYYNQYLKNDEENVIGIKFIDDRVIYYGWIKVIPEEVPSKINQVGPNKWTLVEVVYNTYPGKGVIVD